MPHVHTSAPCVQRYNGGACVAWEDVVAISRWCRERGIRLHLDGARLWEAQAYYQRDWPDICSLFDSVYVSFYKGLGAMAGAMLLGNHSFIQRARIWQRRMGGNVYTSLPYEISARWALESNLMTFAARTNKMRSTIMQMNRYFVVTGWPIRFDPPSPHTCMVHVYLRGKRHFLELARDQVLEVSRIQLFHTLKKVPRWKLQTELEEAPPPPADVLRDIPPPNVGHHTSVPYFASRSNIPGGAAGALPPPPQPASAQYLGGATHGMPPGSAPPHPAGVAPPAMAPAGTAPPTTNQAIPVMDVGGVGAPPPGMTLDLTGTGDPPTLPHPVDVHPGAAPAQGGGAIPQAPVTAPEVPVTSAAVGPASGAGPTTSSGQPGVLPDAVGGRGELVGMLPNSHMHGGVPTTAPNARGDGSAYVGATSARASGVGVTGPQPVVPVPNEFYFEWSIGPSNIQLHENWYIYGWQQFWKYYTDMVRADSRSQTAPTAAARGATAGSTASLTTGGTATAAGTAQQPPVLEGGQLAPPADLGEPTGLAGPVGAPQPSPAVQADVQGADKLLGPGAAELTVPGDTAAVKPAVNAEGEKLMTMARAGKTLTRRQSTQLQRVLDQLGMTLEELKAQGPVAPVEEEDADEGDDNSSKAKGRGTKRRAGSGRKGGAAKLSRKA